MRMKWLGVILLGFVGGFLAGRSHAVLPRLWPAALAVTHADVASDADLAGIDELHNLDVRVTLLNDPKALQQEWSKDAVRLLPDEPVDVGKAAIYASDLRGLAADPTSAIVSYRPDIRDVRVTGDWAFEWGYFDAQVREAGDKSNAWMHGKLLRVLHREDGHWKFARVMAMWKMDVHAPRSH
jgi:ketosteroid isomerase-like protein